jgi:hypothetical protein
MNGKRLTEELTAAATYVPTLDSAYTHPFTETDVRRVSWYPDCPESELPLMVAKTKILPLAGSTSAESYWYVPTQNKERFLPPSLNEKVMALVISSPGSHQNRLVSDQQLSGLTSTRTKRPPPTHIACVINQHKQAPCYFYLSNPVRRSLGTRDTKSFCRRFIDNPTWIVKTKWYLERAQSTSNLHE